jgi:hypothetical protein
MLKKIGCNTVEIYICASLSKMLKQLKPVTTELTIQYHLEPAILGGNKLETSKD